MRTDMKERAGAFERALTEYGPKIQGGIRSLIPNPQDAEDVIAEVKLALWISLPRFDGRSSLGTFIYAVTRNKIKDHLRLKYRDARLRLRAEEELASLGRERPEAERPKVGSLTPSELVVLGLLARGLKNREIARTLFRSQETVRTHTRNINAKLGTRNRAEAAYVFGRCAGE
jgi:RNA polymerase sigma factor (sigma-70 family)